jgi:hypothetical protein
MFQVYGIGQALIPVLPPPIPFETAPTSNQTNYEIGQLVFTPPTNPTAFYLYGGGGNWVQFASNSGDIVAINGTANQVAVSTSAGTATVSLPSAITAPGSLATTTTLAAGTSMSAGTSIAAGTSITATLGNITATNGNLVMGTAGNKIIVPTGSNASAGTSAAMSGSPGAVTVATTACSSTAKVFYSRATTGGTPGQVSITAQDGTGFTLTSTGNETSTFNWWIINA